MRLSAIAARLLLAVVILTLIIILAGFAYYRSALALPFAAGAAVLAITNLYRVWSLNLSVTGAVKSGSMKALLKLQFMYLSRYLLTAAALIFVALSPHISIWGAIWSMATWPVAVFITKYLR